MRSSVRKKPSLDFSITGLVYFAVMIFMGLAAINTQANLLFGVFGMMIGILLVSLTMSRIVLRKLNISRTFPEHGVVGRPASIAYELQNTKRYWPSLSVTLAEIDSADAFMRPPQAYMLHAAPGMTAVVPIEAIPRRRGTYPFDRFQISTSFPFGFVKRAQQRRLRDTLLVYPPIGGVSNRLLQMCKSAESAGPVVRPKRGGDDEFYGLKDFRSGESPRYIYWKRSARTGVLVTKEMTHVSPPRIVVLVDTFLMDRTPKSHADVEKVIAMAASLISTLLEQDLPVGLVAWNGSWVGVSPQRGKRHRRDLLTLLAMLPLNTSGARDRLIEESYQYVKTGTTRVLISPSPSGTDAGSGRSGLILVSPNDPQAKSWFEFDDSIDFARCMPPEQEPDVLKGVP